MGQKVKRHCVQNEDGEIFKQLFSPGLDPLYVYSVVGYPLIIKVMLHHVRAYVSNYIMTHCARLWIVLVSCHYDYILRKNREKWFNSLGFLHFHHAMEATVSKPLDLLQLRKWRIPRKLTLEVQLSRDLLLCLHLSQCKPVEKPIPSRILAGHFVESFSAGWNMLFLSYSSNLLKCSWILKPALHSFYHTPCLGTVQCSSVLRDDQSLMHGAPQWPHVLYATHIVFLEI